MEVLGQGLAGLVVADTPETVKKFYIGADKGRAEQDYLTYLGSIKKQGFSIDCPIPALAEAVGEGNWEINGKNYDYCNRIERLAGTSGRRILPNFTEQATERLGTAVGSTAYAMHTNSMPYIEEWTHKSGNTDGLLEHILNDKAGSVISEGSNSEVIRLVKDAANYLQEQCSSLASTNILCHLDFSLANIQTDASGKLYGLVDWVYFGLTNPSLSLYQLAYREIWPYAQQQYEQLGGSLREDIIYAAAAIHLAWAPVISKQLNFPLDADETHEKFKVLWENFEACRID